MVFEYLFYTIKPDTTQTALPQYVLGTRSP